MRMIDATSVRQSWWCQKDSIIKGRISTIDLNTSPLSDVRDNDG